ncbi:MAG: hypothetical protein V5A64_03700 [Candidatus Thermoplasmatota archaeon]
MPEFRNDELIGHLLQTVVEVIGRRTSENYSIMALEKVLNNLEERFDFLKEVGIKDTKFSESEDAIIVESGVNTVEIDELINASKLLLRGIIKILGENAGFFFIKEIKESLPYEYQQSFEENGLDLDAMQNEFLVEKSRKQAFEISNEEILRYVFKTLFDVLSKIRNRNFAFSILDEIVERFSTQYKTLECVTINDIHVRGKGIVSINKKVNSIDSKEIGVAIQKMLQQTNIALNDHGVLDFIDKFREEITSRYALKLGELNVNVDAIRMSQYVVVKRTVKSLIDVLSEVSAESYAIMSIDKSLYKLSSDYEALNYIKIDRNNYSSGFDAVSISKKAEYVSPIKMGRSLQALIEDVSSRLGSEAGYNFVDRFKKRMGDPYLLRLEEMGVNLHMIDLRQNLVW